MNIAAKKEDNYIMKRLFKSLLFVVVSMVIAFSFVGCSCSSTDPTKLIFSNSPYVEYDDSWTSSDWESWTFEITQNGHYSFEYAAHKYSIPRREYTHIAFDKVQGNWEFVGTFSQSYEVYQTSAKLLSATKNQTLAIYKLNGLMGGYSASIDSEGNITSQEVGTMQGYCVYRYGGTYDWSAGTIQGICVFFTNETIDTTLLDSTIDSDSKSTAWNYGSIGEYNYYKNVK